MKLLYFRRDGRTVEDPLPTDHLSRMSERAEIDPLTPVCVEGCSEWLAFNDFFENRPVRTRMPGGVGAGS